jgi:hypothetical protein
MIFPQSGQPSKSGQRIWLTHAVSPQSGHTLNLTRLGQTDPEINPKQEVSKCTPRLSMRCSQ